MSIVCGDCQISVNASGAPLPGVNGSYNFSVARGAAVALSGKVQAGAGNRTTINTSRSNIKHGKAVEPLGAGSIH